jgi:hypothetical protein
VFLTLDLFLDISEFDEIRPRSGLYVDMRRAGHALVSPDQPVLKD